MNRIVDLTDGIAFVVTDLHGAWEPYVLYRDHFLDLYEAGKADYFIILGDAIHGYGDEDEDASLHIVLDIMLLRQELGADRVIMLMGNHELPHVYGVILSKGNLVFTPRFEHILGEHRQEVIQFFKQLPFFIRTHAGVLLTHAGASADTLTEEAYHLLSGFSHDDLLLEVDQLMVRDDIGKLLATYGVLSGEDYDRMVWENLAVNDKDNPRYLDLLRGFIVGNLEPEWSLLWSLLFTQCERASGALIYKKIVADFLARYSSEETVLRAMVTGHIVVKGGYEIIADKQLRLASWAHARPHHAGSYLLFDVAEPIEDARMLSKYVYPMPK